MSHSQETVVEPEVLIPRLKAISDANPDVRIFVRGDQAVTYGKVCPLWAVSSQLDFKRSHWWHNCLKSNSGLLMKHPMEC